MLGQSSAQRKTVTPPAGAVGDNSPKDRTARKQASAIPITLKKAVKAPDSRSKKSRWRMNEHEAFLVRSLPIAVYRANLEGRFVGPRHLNEDLAKATGFAAVGFVANADLWPSRIHPDDLPRVLAEVAASREAGSFSVEYRWLCADGSERVFQDKGTVFTGREGPEIHGACLDITERRRLERQLLWAQRLESVGHYMEDLAHDLMNMLSVTIWNLDGMLRALDKGDANANGKDRMRLNTAMTGASNAADLLKQLTSCARQPAQRPRQVDVAAMLKNMEKMLALVLSDRVTFQIAPMDGLWPVFIEQAQLEAALIALVLNARETLAGGGGTLRLEAANFDLDDGMRGETLSDMAPGGYVMLTLDSKRAEKSGPGEEMISAPRFDSLEKGLGLGLAQEFARRWGGRIAVERATGTETRMRWYMPRSEAE